jgi:hypothetical protein
VRIAIDSWAPGFGTALRGDEDLQPAPGPVDYQAEVRVDDWAPRRPPPGVTPATDIRFVDGVRRMDARVWAIDGDTTRPALAVSFAAGTIRTNGRATVEDLEVRRMVFGPAGLPAITAGSVAYQAHAVAGQDDDALIGAVQQRMRQLEAELTGRPTDAPITIVDGPLSGRQHVPGAIGYIKTHHTAYLPPAVNGVVAELQPGERTPLFLTQTSWNRYSWYLRLPHGRGHPWAGVVRLEASADLSMTDAVALADRTAATLPRFASHPHRDPRAPQNLYPIAGLERALKRRLGDAAYLERILRSAVNGATSA